jgi:hypothetical protein
MKRIILTISIIFTLCLCANAQNDGFFSSWSGDYSDRSSGGISSPGLIAPQTLIGNTDNANATPLGNGILVLSVLGACYSIFKRNSKD